jgi:hypothetical protein
MTCDNYENALLLAAASNDKLDVKLARHLEHCSTCRLTLRSERELFSRIDSTLRAQVNQDPPSAFLAQLRLQLSKEATAPPGSNRVWHVAGAAFALIFNCGALSLGQCATIKCPRELGDAHDQSGAECRCNPIRTRQ